MTSLQRISWPRIFAEGIAIVVSILLAFGIQAWWELRNQRLALQSDLSALVDEFHATRMTLQSSLDWHRRIEAAAKELQQRLQTGNPSSPVIIPDTLIALVLAMPTLDLPTADLQHLQAAVDFSAVEDSELTQRLIAFSRVVEDQNDAEDRGSQLVRTRLAAELDRQVDISEIWMSLPDFVLGRDTPVYEGTTAVSPTSTLRSMLGERAFYSWDAAFGAERAITRANRVIEALEAYVAADTL